MVGDGPVPRLTLTATRPLSPSGVAPASSGVMPRGSPAASRSPARYSRYPARSASGFGTQWRASPPSVGSEPAQRGGDGGVAGGTATTTATSPEWAGAGSGGHGARLPARSIERSRYTKRLRRVP